jgi:hypothetical protein
MNRTSRTPIGLIRVLLACFLAALSGCASIPPPEQDAPDVVEPEAQTEPPVTPRTAVEPTPSPPPASPYVKAARPFSGKAAIVLSDRSPAFENVATELGYLLDAPLVYNLADKSQSPEDAFARISESGAAVVIAIGFSATRAAARRSTVPVIYCQVFNFIAEDPVVVPVKGVAAMPPLSVQLEAWRRLDPQLSNIGAILGDGHEDLIAEATRATAAHGVKFHHQSAGSDRETLYLFKRMAPDIDGFWLFPDNRVLSIPVLRNIVEIAARHHVRIAVFNEALLELGVSLSTAAVASDIAATVLAVAGEVAAGDIDAVPDLTPLHKVKTRAGSPAGGRADAIAAGPGSASGTTGSRL